MPDGDRNLSPEPPVPHESRQPAADAPVRVAVCIVGEARTFNASRVHANLFENLVHRPSGDRVYWS